MKTSPFSLNFFRSVADSCATSSSTSTPRLHTWAGSGSKHSDSCLRLKTLCLAFSSNSAVEHTDLFTRSNTVRKMSLSLTSTFLPFVMLFSHCAETNGNLRCVEFVCFFKDPAVLASWALAGSTVGAKARIVDCLYSFLYVHTAKLVFEQGKLWNVSI